VFNIVTQGCQQQYITRKVKYISNNVEKVIPDHNIKEGSQNNTSSEKL